MKILLTNDDGFDADGITILADELQKNGHEIIIAAPLTQQSAKSHSISLFKPMQIIEKGEKYFAISGTPADCMILASQLLVDDSIDLVISGINAGQNMGEDVLYSGTVAAAIEAMFLGFKSIAISIASYQNQKFETAAKYLCEMLKNGIQQEIGKNEILNINVPNLKYDEVKGFKTTCIGHRKYYNFVRTEKSENGETVYFIGGDEPHWSEIENSDANAVKEGYISITPIAPDFTKKKIMPKLQKWIEKL
ncbi:MAG: 5'/3'-nucleotidase SurE [Candidatus Cloacimonetes bacterium]|jgi:5'-nucleotidase|nr:5'/3'-nucleotidase SurE [Candidatus Cloacimonadota bacterium]MBT6994796.1 5'/3'-nucleotidase SurE [Candidatus Cloacimonadota bacterium]MBT7469197.1 5'/3'-nucleotidase SurE [Candidatus Cloacimonadota bacterium]